MAVLDSLPGLEVSVSVAAKDLHEYECQDEEPDGLLAKKTVLRYIESISDAEFEINFRLSAPFQLDCGGLNFRVEIDGKAIRGKLCSKKKFLSGHWSCTLLGRKSILPNGKAEISKFKFSPLKTSVEDSDTQRIKTDSEKFPKVGQIKIGVLRVHLGRMRASCASHDKTTENIASEVAEKAIKGKALSHHTTFSAPVPSTNSGTCSITYVDGHDKPIAIFDFRYLSKRALQQKLIIPRSPSPDPYDALSNAEKERLGRLKLAELKTRNKKVDVKLEKSLKRERETEGEVEVIDFSGESFASNVSARPLKTIRMPDSNETIDLTD